MIVVEVVDPAQTRELRRSVLRPSQPLSDPLPGDGMSGAIHFGAVEDGVVLATCFVYTDPCPGQPGRPAWRLRQMATWPHRQGQGLGGQVVESAVTALRARGAELLW